MRKPISAEWLPDDVRKLVLDHIHGATQIGQVNFLVEEIVERIETVSERSAEREASVNLDRAAALEATKPKE